MNRSDQSIPAAIPYNIRLGVTGHRTLHDEAALDAALQSILNSGYLDAFSPEARQSLTKATNTPISFTLVSPLAEGADRLVARAVLAHGGLLEALLPMPRVEYEKDFDTPESLAEFAGLLARAHRLETLDCSGLMAGADYRPNAYRNVGVETVKRCDILIALWDGKPSRGVGGTADIMALALEQQKPVFILSTERIGMVELKNDGQLTADFIEELENFNSFRIDDAELQTACDRDFAEVFPSHLAERIPEHLQQSVKKHLIPPYSRASIIAGSHQKRYKQTGKRGYLFSTLAVAFMAFAVIFARYPFFSIPGYVAELCLLIALYLMIHRAEHARVHPGWLENRALAERLRTAFYFVACGESPEHTLKGRSIYLRSQSWVDLAYHGILSNLPQLAKTDADKVRPYRQFIDAAWLQGQIDYHGKNAAKLSRKNDNLKSCGMWCFKFAIVISSIHLGFSIFGVTTGHHPEGALLLSEELLSIIAITLPAAGAAFVGYRSLLEQSRIAARSRAMVYHLTRISQQPLGDAAGLRRYLDKIQEIMLIESEDWLALMEHAELEKIA